MSIDESRESLCGVCVCVCVCLQDRDKTQRSRGEEREGDSCFSSFCFMLGPSSSLVATRDAFIRVSHTSEFGEVLSPVCVCLFVSYLIISHLLAVIPISFEPADVFESHVNEEFCVR